MKKNPSLFITFYEKIMIFYVKSYNFTIGYHNITVRCYNFLRKERVFLLFKILNKKKLQVLKYILKNDELMTI